MNYVNQQYPLNFPPTQVSKSFNTPSLLHRYQSGDQIAVWRDLHYLNDAVRSGHRLEDARAVVNETLARVRTNIDLIIERLHGANYEFLYRENRSQGLFPARMPPSPNASQLVDFLNELCGPIPLIIEAWIEQIGDVYLVGDHPQWPGKDMYTDALVIEFEGSHFGIDLQELFSYYQSEFDSWQDEQNGLGTGTPWRFCLPFAPDIHHKVRVSGGPAYGVYLPDAGADAVVDIGDRRIYFVDYLRECFAWGGFPGFKTHENGRDNGTLSQLTADLLRI